MNNCDNPLVSIIVPVYNQEQYLADTLDSVLNQSFNEWECIIINDGSSDESARIAHEYTERDSRFKYLYQKNSGVVLARNNAIYHSKGKFILPLDGDDVLAPEYLSMAVEIMEKNDDIKLVYCDVEYIGAKQGLVYLPDLTVRNIIHAGCCVNTSLFRRTAFDMIGGYKEEMKEGYEDWEFFMSIMELEGKVYKIKKVLFYYRVLNESRNRSIPKDTLHRLKRNLFCLHPNLYYDDYNRLMQENIDLNNKLYIIDNSRSYSFYCRLIKPIKKLVDVFKGCSSH